MKVKFDDPQFSFQFLRVLGSAASHQADVGECFATANRIVEGDFESWAREWTSTGTLVEGIAAACLAKYHRVSAGDTYLRATNYYRAAEFYLGAAGGGLRASAGGVLDFLGPRIPHGVTRAQFAAALREAPAQVEAAIRAAAAKSPEARWSLENGMYTFQASSPSDWLKKLLDYDMSPHAKRIRCPTLVVDVESENGFAGEAKKLYDLLTYPKTWMFFTEEEGGGDHCQTGSPTLGQQRILDLLDETVATSRPTE